MPPVMVLMPLPPELATKNIEPKKTKGGWAPPATLIFIWLTSFLSFRPLSVIAMTTLCCNLYERPRFNRDWKVPSIGDD